MIGAAIRARFRRKMRDGTASPLTLAQIQSAIEAGWAGERVSDMESRHGPMAINWEFLEQLGREDDAS